MKLFLLASFLYIFSPILLIAQNNQEIYNWFDNQIGIENTGLFNGIEYVGIEKGSNGLTKFLNPDTFSTGFVSYDGQTYYDVALKYNVYDEKIIVNIGENSGKKLFELFSAKVDSFSIDNRKFIKRKSLEGDKSQKTTLFDELILQGKDIRLFKKREKSKATKIKNKSVYFEYKWLKPIYHLLYKGELYEVRKKQDFIEIFPQFKTELKALKINRNRARNNPDDEVSIYFNKINSLLISGL